MTVQAVEKVPVNPICLTSTTVGQIIKEFVTYYNNEQYHESLYNMTPADVYFGRVEEVKSKRERIKQETMEERRRQHRQGVQDKLYWNGESSLILRPEMSH